MFVALKNTFLQVLIHSKGAELCSVKNKHGLEFMWQADPQVWPRHAPVLFPIVGRLKDDSYQYDATTYQLSQHGFARDSEFSLIKQSDTQLVFELCSNPNTKLIFPFDFKFRISYTLVASQIDITYEVENTSSNDLYFSVGAHPGFRCPLLPNETMADYYLEFEKDHYALTLLNAGLRSEKTVPFVIPNKQLGLQASLFDNDALVFENGQIQAIALRSRKNDHAIEMSCKNWPFFGIWSKKGSEDFICLEPWMGIADSTKTSGKLEEKTGITRLKGRSSFDCSHSINFK